MRGENLYKKSNSRRLPLQQCRRRGINEAKGVCGTGRPKAPKGVP